MPDQGFPPSLLPPPWLVLDLEPDWFFFPFIQAFFFFLIE
jgi:hypothetical protein